jgi:hypothetical protein
MAEPERLAALKRCLAEYRSQREAVNEQLPVAPGPERGALAAQSKVVARKIEQTEVEIGFIENVNGLIQRYTELQREALDGARTESDPVRQKAFEDRAALCRAVAEEALEKKQEVKPIPPGTLDQILKELNTAAQQAKKTVDSINNAIKITNKVLDVLIVLAKAAAKFAV